MDKAGYKAYLQSLGNQQYYIGRIQELLELEQELNIDLDDYIPYDDDYSKVSALDAILPMEKRYGERLNFSINSYMRYRLSGFEKNEEAETKMNSDPICSEYFTFCGTESELKEKLSTFMSEKDSQSFVNGLQDYLQYLGEDEFVEKTTLSTGTDILFSGSVFRDSALYKHSGFQEEHEWRLISHCASYFSGSKQINPGLNNIEFACINENIKSHITLDLRKNWNNGLIQSVVLGPKFSGNEYEDI